jgi:hypothetical protein
MATSILDLLNVPRALTLEFMATFARFEFALKKSGYARGDDSQVSPKTGTLSRTTWRSWMRPFLRPCWGPVSICSSIHPRNRSWIRDCSAGSIAKELRVRQSATLC